MKPSETHEEVRPYPCPTCSATPGSDCVTGTTGKRAIFPHQARRDLAAGNRPSPYSRISFATQRERQRRKTAESEVPR